MENENRSHGKRTSNSEFVINDLVTLGRSTAVLDKEMLVHMKRYRRTNDTFWSQIQEGFGQAQF